MQAMADGSPTPLILEDVQRFRWGVSLQRRSGQVYLILALHPLEEGSLTSDRDGHNPSKLEVMVVERAAEGEQLVQVVGHVLLDEVLPQHVDLSRPLNSPYLGFRDTSSPVAPPSSNHPAFSRPNSPRATALCSVLLPVSKFRCFDEPFKSLQAALRNDVAAIVAYLTQLVPRAPPTPGMFLAFTSPVTLHCVRKHAACLVSASAVCIEHEVH